MKRLALAVLFLVFASNAAFAASIYWSRVTTYTDNTAIPAAKIPTIVYRVYYGTTATGPFTVFGTATDNVGVVVPPAALPAMGADMYYTADASLDNATSVLAPSFRHTRSFVPTQAPAGFRLVYP